SGYGAKTQPTRSSVVACDLANEGASNAPHPTARQDRGYGGVSALALAVEAAEAFARSSSTVTSGLTAAVRSFERFCPVGPQQGASHASLHSSLPGGCRHPTDRGR